MESGLKPDYLFEVSWEVCNKVGGIYAVLTTKALTLVQKWDDRLIMIGPDVWKGTDGNPEFIEDKTLFKIWRQQIDQEGLKVKIGRWQIPGKPIVVLVDFTPYFLEKNEIFKHLWVKYQLDSLNGQWEYIEPAIFGYVAGKVIASFYHCHINSTDRVVAHFHEWMTGTGVLFLEDHVPQIATVFTTHATVIGRAIAGKGYPFYKDFDKYQPEQMSREFNLVSKHSLEKISAHNADCFTTVSEITGAECERMLGKSPDAITPNGFDVSIVPAQPEFGHKREQARKKILQVAEGLYNQKFPENSLLVIKSGRYEFKNKGIDVFIEALAELNYHISPGKKVIAVIFVPGHHTGPRKDLLDRMNQPDLAHPLPKELLTHNLQGVENDAIVQEIKRVKLNQEVGDVVKVIFVPTYVNGHDGVFNMSYYDLLIGFDLAVFPSYYEPWGYTPLESLAFHIPAATTNISGFGAAVQGFFGSGNKGVYIIERNDDNKNKVMRSLAELMDDFSKKNEEGIQEAREEAHRISQEFLWDKQILRYERAYELALQKSIQRKGLYRDKPQAIPPEVIKVVETKPIWREVNIATILPDNLAELQKLSMNLWWSWNEEATDLFREIDEALWKESHFNPVLFLHNLDYTALKRLEKDTEFLQRLQKVTRDFEDYLAKIPKEDKPLVAYFSMEFGLHNTLKIYSGGLGVLAGDFLKEASDRAVSMVGVGLFYKQGYFRQNLSVHGEQMVAPEQLDVRSLPLEPVLHPDQKPLKIALAFPGRTVLAQVWKLAVGRVSLYLLDSFVEENNAEDRLITSQLYGGTAETRLQQEILLGIGGVQLLDALGISPDIYHCNEGHAAFISIARMYGLVLHENLSFEEALEVTRATQLFTTHTSVPAAMDQFSEELLRPYFSHMATQLNISWETWMNLGKVKENSLKERFSMTHLALKMAQEVNGVSRLHGEVSRKLFRELWEDFFPEELHIGHVTNGVHYATWTAKVWKKVHQKYLGDSLLAELANKTLWEKAKEIPDQVVWETRIQLKRDLLLAVRDRLTETMTLRHESPRKIREAISLLHENAFLIGFARRFVEYKRPELILMDLERLAAIIGQVDQPVLIFFAGKAHPQDTRSRDKIKSVFDISRKPGLRNKVFFLEDYDMNLAKLLVQGVDLWINTPNRQMEASGTSGMKAMLNGVLNFSVLDGWWAEAYREEIGWALEGELSYERQDYQDELDSDKIYKTLENEVLPLYFNRDANGLPSEWIQRIKASMASSYNYTMSRTLGDYQRNYYEKLWERGKKMTSNNFALAQTLAEWKKKVLQGWKEVDVLSIETNIKFTKGNDIFFKVMLDIGNFSIQDIGVEVVLLPGTLSGTEQTGISRELAAQTISKEKVTYECKVPYLPPGTYTYSFRIFPKHPALPHRQDFPLVKWG